jgi:uncharacterized membrane protein
MHVVSWWAALLQLLRASVEAACEQLENMQIARLRMMQHRLSRQHCFSACIHLKALLAAGCQPPGTTGWSLQIISSHDETQCTFCIQKDACQL